MPIVAVVLVVMVVAVPFPIIAVGPVVAVVVALFSGVINAEAAANRICTTHAIEVLLFWADPSHKTLLLIHKGYLLSPADGAEW
jgi:hypothetical protein